METNLINMVIVLVLLLIGVIINIITSIWIYRDAIRQGNNNEYALIVLFGTLLLPFIGAFVYLIIRKNKKSERKSKC